MKKKKRKKKKKKRSRSSFQLLTCSWWVSLRFYFFPLRFRLGLFRFLNLISFFLYLSIYLSIYPPFFLTGRRFCTRNLCSLFRLIPSSSTSYYYDHYHHYYYFFYHHYYYFFYHYCSSMDSRNIETFDTFISKYRLSSSFISSSSSRISLAFCPSFSVFLSSFFHLFKRKTMRHPRPPPSPPHHKSAGNGRWFHSNDNWATISLTHRARIGIPKSYIQRLLNCDTFKTKRI